MERIVRNFKLVEQIGTGGMGAVYKAIQTTLDRKVAFKELHPQFASDADFIRRFEREAKTAAGLQHENIVGVIDFGKEGGSYFIAMEFVDGFDLKAMMSRDPKVVLPVAITVLCDTLKGLAHAHARGVIHRDIKPANVMVTHDGIAKIADFSIAQPADQPSMTVTGAMMGTPAYMSPEQAAGGRPLDARTDLFSAGVILYEMLAGARPFDGDTYASVISKLLTVTPPELSELDRTVPASITRVAKKALEKDPDRRYRTADEFRNDLEHAAEAEKIPLGRSLVTEWVKSPREFQNALRRRQAQEAFQRGLYLMNQGLSHLDEAIASLETAVAWDPENTAASEKLESLRSRRQTSTGGASWKRPAGITAVVAAGALLVGLAAKEFGGGTTPAATPTPLAIETSRAPATATPPPATPVETQAVAAVSPRITARHTGTPVATVKVVAVETATATATPVATATAAPSPTHLALVDPESKEGFLKIVVKPWAKVFVDGKFVADTPVGAPIRLSSGSHELKLVNESFEDYVETIDVPRGTIISRNVTLKPR